MVQKKEGAGELPPAIMHSDCAASQAKRGQGLRQQASRDEHNHHIRKQLANQILGTHLLISHLGDVKRNHMLSCVKD